LSDEVSGVFAALDAILITSPLSARWVCTSKMNEDKIFITFAQKIKFFHKSLCDASRKVLFCVRYSGVVVETFI
jgi:hypothetical protein